MADGTGTEAIGLEPAAGPAGDRILDPAALALLAELHRRFEPGRRRLLAARRERQARVDEGALPDFRPQTRELREADWTVAPVPPVLCDRRVEITGPVDRKTVINALNAGARVYMADFEDSTSPRFDTLVDGQANLADAVAGTIGYSAPDGRHYALRPGHGTRLMVRPRGWHLPEKHLRIDGEPIAGALFDAALFVHHNGRRLAAGGAGPWLYLAKLEAFEEAVLWDQVLAFLEQRLGLDAGTIKVTVLVETLPAVFEMDEILHALRRRVLGLNCGRWDYIFSYIKTFRRHPERVLPERGQLTMTVPFLRAFSGLLIRTCHRRGALAMGGMAAQIPVPGNAAATAAAMDKVRADKLREVRAGHDGTWVAHPALIPVAMAVFDAHMPGPNQLQAVGADPAPDRDALIAPCRGSISRAGFENNLDVAVRYLAAWLDGSGCVPLHHLMEDAATAEIGRAQLWQWLHTPGVALDDGTPVEWPLFDAALAGVAERLGDDQLAGRARIAEATALLAELTLARELADFLTLPAYRRLP